MQISTMHQNWQYGLLNNSLLTVKHLLQITPDEHLTSFRDRGTGWTVTEVLCHLRDFEAVFLERAYLTINEKLADLPFPDPDQLAIDKQYAEQDAKEVHAEWAKIREELLAFFKARSEDEWGRVAIHPKRGHFTLYDQLILMPWHDINHLEQITRILAEQKMGSV